MLVLGFTMQRESKCGTSVSGPLKIVKDDMVFGTQTDASHAMLAGPGASRGACGP